jgi:hypothetical protein
MYACFLLTHPATIFSPHAKRPHGLKAEAIGKKKWGIATDRLQKNQNLRTWLLVPAPWVSGSCLLGSCLLGSGVNILHINVQFLNIISAMVQ